MPHSHGAHPVSCKKKFNAAGDVVLSRLTRPAAVSRRCWRIAFVTLLLLVCGSSHVYSELLPGFQKPDQFDEQVRWSRLESGVRVFVAATTQFNDRPRTLVVFATPNGNTIEQTLGCAASKDRDFRFDIQHIAAQMRRLREIDSERDFVLAVVQAPQLSWPTFRREQSHANTIIRDLMTSLEIGRAHV